MFATKDMIQNCQIASGGNCFFAYRKTIKTMIRNGSKQGLYIVNLADLLSQIGF